MAGGPTYLRGAAHKPGAVPLRPLGLTDIYDAAFRIIRFNPKATVGAAVLVASIAMVLPLVVTVVLTTTSSLALDAGGDGSFAGADVAAFVGTGSSFLVGIVLQWVGTLLVTGLVVHVSLAAATGRRLSLGEAWAATRGSRWRLVGLSALIFLAYTVLLGLYALAWFGILVIGSTPLTIAWGVVSVPSLLCLLVWLWVRFAYLAVPALMAERPGILRALGRARHLTRKQFWRTFGIALLTLVVTSIASQVLTGPIGIVGALLLVGLGPDYAVLGQVVIYALTTVISAAFVTPFTAAVTSLQYVDQRMRKEAFDVELMQQAGVTGT